MNSVFKDQNIDLDVIQKEIIMDEAKREMYKRSGEQNTDLYICTINTLFVNLFKKASANHLKNLKERLVQSRNNHVFPSMSSGRLIFNEDDKDLKNIIDFLFENDEDVEAYYFCRGARTTFKTYDDGIREIILEF